MAAALANGGGARPTSAGGGGLNGLRVDRRPDPFGRLESLLNAADAFAHFNRAAERLMGGDPAAALRTIDAAVMTLPDDENLRFLRAGALLAVGDVDTGLGVLRSLVAARPSWERVIRSFAEKG